MSPTFFHAAVIAGQNFSHNAIIPTQQSGALCVPTEGTVTQRYSSNHPAIDISSVSGQGKGAAVRACATGTVVYVGVAELPQDNPNNVKHAVAIRHDDQIDGKYIMSFYIHMGSDNDSYVTVQQGARVRQGDVIGYQGVAGIATGTHLHWSIHPSTTAFLDSYSSWGKFCQRSDLWFEIGGSSSGNCHNMNGASPVNPELYTGGLGANVTSTCSQLVAYRGEFVAQDVQLSMVAGTTQVARIQLRNTGTASWDGNTKLYALPLDQDNPFYHSSWLHKWRIASTGIVQPSEVGTFEFTLQAPMETGVYRIEFAFVQEGVTWFTEPPNAAIWFPITITTRTKEDSTLYIPMLK